MKRTAGGFGFGAIGAALLLGTALACGGAGESASRGVGQGKVVSVGEGEVVLDHGEIPGMMKAMTMGFGVDDPSLLEGIEPGQQVQFHVEYADGRYRVTAIRPETE